MQNITHKKYLLFLVSFFFLLFVPIFVSNLYFNYIEFISNRVGAEAARWQDKTQGLPFVAAHWERQLKIEKLKKLLSQQAVNTIIVGASTVMGIKDYMFPKNQILYNFSVSNNSTNYCIHDIEYLLQKDNLSHFLIALDWAPGLLIHPVSPASDWWSYSEPKTVSWLDMAKDSLTTSKAKIFLYKFWELSDTNDPLEVFRRIFFLSSSDIRCPDGNVGRNFSLIGNNQQCLGFYPDGSRNYFYFSPLLQEDTGPSTIASYVRMNSENWPKWLKFHSEISTKLSDIIKKIKTKNADIFFILPPLAPGIEKKILETHGRELLQFKKSLHDFAVRNNVQILDMGQSEEYGCKFSEFLDSIHASHACFEKLLPHFLRQRDKIGYGVISSAMLSR